MNQKSNMHCGAIKFVYQKARELRNESTHAEQILWGYLQTKPLGFKFRRQHPYSSYILDFYCHSLRFVIEVDGSIHDIKEVMENDKIRQDLLEKDGLKVLRFSNQEIVTLLENITKKIEAFIIKCNDELKRP